MDDCRTKYPILLVHGTGFRDLKYPLYWGRIPKVLEERGARVFYGMQDSWGSIEKNAAALKLRVVEILRETGAEKLNLIGHSKGGLEIRMLASSLGMADSIASVTTVATPHRGSKTIDRLFKASNGLFNVAAFAVNNWVRVVGDKNPDFIAVCRGFSTENMERFNRENPDVPSVFYQSVGCVMASPFSDINLSTANFVVGRIDGENDGLVSLESARWGENFSVWRGVSRRGISHLDAIDLRRTQLVIETARGVMDVTEAYASLVARLKKRGL